MPSLPRLGLSISGKGIATNPIKDPCGRHTSQPRDHATLTLEEVIRQEGTLPPDGRILAALGVNLEDSVRCAEMYSSRDQNPDCPYGWLTIQTDFWTLRLERPTGAVRSYEWNAAPRPGVAVSKESAASTANALLVAVDLPQRVSEANVASEPCEIRVNRPETNNETDTENIVEPAHYVVIRNEHIPFLPHFSVNIGERNGQILRLDHNPRIPLTPPNILIPDLKAREIALDYLKQQNFHRPAIVDCTLSLAMKRAESEKLDEDWPCLTGERTYAWYIRAEAHFQAGSDHIGKALEWASGNDFWFGKMGSPTISIDVETGEIVEFDD